MSYEPNDLAAYTDPITPEVAEALGKAIGLMLVEVAAGLLKLANFQREQAGLPPLASSAPDLADGPER